MSTNSPILLSENSNKVRFIPNFIVVLSLKYLSGAYRFSRSFYGPFPLLLPSSAAKLNTSAFSRLHFRGQAICSMRNFLDDKQVFSERRSRIIAKSCFDQATNALLFLPFYRSCRLCWPSRSLLMPRYEHPCHVSSTRFQFQSIKKSA